ncbi:MAG: glycosyltransferase [Bacteroidales bacterium]|nr:glycosyltransferase [Bacteroidales bacterium]
MQDYLPKCVESVRKQTLHELEIILVENASSDDSLKLCQAYAALDSRIRVMHLDVGDLSTARNRGVAEATSEYVAFLDSDDSIAPDMYATLYGFAVENKLDLVYSNHVHVFDDKPPKYHYKETGKSYVLTPKELLMMNFAHKVPLNSCTMIVKRKFFDTMQFPEFKYYEDRAFTYLLIAASERVGYIDKAFYLYYQRKGSIVHSKHWKMYYDFAHAEKERLEFIMKSQMFTDEEKRMAAKKVTETFLAKLLRTNRKAKTKEQKGLSRKLVHSMSLIPKECKIKMKSRLYRRIIKALY